MYAAANRLLRGAKRARPEAQGISKAAFRRFHRRWWRSRRLCWWPLSVASISLRIIRKKKRKRCKIARPPATACRPNRKSAGAILKSWKAASLASARRPNRPPVAVMKPEQLTDEQRQLLAQMQADMRQQPTQLTEVPWNEQTPAQRQQTLPASAFSAATAAGAAATVGADSGADRPTAAAARSAAEAGSAATTEADRVKPAAVPGSAADASAYQYHAAAYPGRGAGNSGGRSAENHRREERRS